MDSKTKAQALADYLECDLEDVKAPADDNGRPYQTDIFRVSEGYSHDTEYLVFTEEEADEACAEAVENSLWAFNSDFLQRFLGLPEEAQEMLRVFQETKCEDANDTIRAMLGDDFDYFVEEAVSADGRAHFLAQYDSEEIEVTVGKGDKAVDLFIYRVN